ncbi:MAG: UDP-3-O-(3-hydroxymyristoyl)glucosamine N-acyltransferase, partial [Armatimonadota bacterium]|nr:UDP-3-O-(3-hydroxymyristoyl)glucosamine N-acyltransferase [Armatimonadota bacterium]
MAGQVGIGDHLTIGAGARILGQAGVTKDVAAGATVSGYPARDHRQALRLDATLARLPELLERVRALEARLDARGRRR